MRRVFPKSDPLERKLRHLLTFYRLTLRPEQVALLGLVSLSRAPTPEATVLMLARGMPSLAAILADQSDSSNFRSLSAMAHEHLLTYDRAADGATSWTCHPVLRDHFRQVVLGLGTDTGPEAAGLLAGRPGGATPSEFRALQPVLTAVELLLDAGELTEADRLFRERLDNGQVFRRLDGVTGWQQPNVAVGCGRPSE